MGESLGLHYNILQGEGIGLWEQDIHEDMCTCTYLLSCMTTWSIVTLTYMQYRPSHRFQTSL